MCELGQTRDAESEKIDDSGSGYYSSYAAPDKMLRAAPAPAPVANFTKNKSPAAIIFVLKTDGGLEKFT